MSKSSDSKKKSSRLSPVVIIGGLAIVFLVAVGTYLFGNPSPKANPGETVTAPPPTVVTITQPPPASLPVSKLPRANIVQGDWYTAYFTIPSYPEKKENRTGGVDTALIADLDRAQKNIDAAVFDFRLPSLTDAFVRAAQRGVQVRLVTDYAANQDAKEYTDAIEAMEKGGVKIFRDHRSALMHNKFVVIDNQLLWTGSMNFTPNDVYRNNNNMLRLAIPELIANYTTRFERLMRATDSNLPGKEIPNPRITLNNGVTIENYFSPTGGTAQAVLNKLKAAKKSIRVTAFSFTDTAMGDVLKGQAKANIAVQGVFESRNNGGLGAEYPALKSAGLDVLEDGNCYILHSKTMVIDNRYVITGSYNFTGNAEKANDENLLIIDDPKLAKAYATEFDRIYKQAKSPTQCGGDVKTLDIEIQNEQ